MLSKREKIDIQEFAEKITPTSWNICLNKNEYKPRAGILNVYIDFLGGQRQLDAEDEMLGPFKGRVPWPIRMESNGRLFIIHVELCVDLIFYTNQGGNRKPVFEINQKEVIVHELAHVAVNRWQDWRFKTHKACTSGKTRKYDQYTFGHGQAFLRAFELLIIRTEKQFGKNMVKTLWQDLKECQRAHAYNVSPG